MASNASSALKICLRAFADFCRSGNAIGRARLTCCGRLGKIGSNQRQFVINGGHTVHLHTFTSICLLVPDRPASFAIAVLWIASATDWLWDSGASTSDMSQFRPFVEGSIMASQRGLCDSRCWCSLRTRTTLAAVCLREAKYSDSDGKRPVQGMYSVDLRRPDAAPVAATFPIRQASRNP